MLVGMLLLIILFFILTAIIVFLILIFISGIISNIHGVPYVSMKRKNIGRLLSWSGLSTDDIFYDLGCGDARVLIAAVKNFGVKNAVGYEIAPWSYLEARFSLWLAGARDKTQIFRRNFFQADLMGASFIYAYLFPKPIDRLAYKLAKELRSGSKILCPSFPIDFVRHPEFKLLKTENIDKISVYLYEKT